MSIVIKNGVHEISMQRVTFGPNNFVEAGDFKLYEKLLDMYVDAGGESIDTARMYSEGFTEAFIGAWMKKRGNREKLVLTTKGAHPPVSDMTKSRLDRASIFSDMKESLTALGTDYVDVYLLHRDDRNLPVEDIVDTLDELVKQGYAKVCGVSNWQTDRIIEANAYAEKHGKAIIGVSQINFSLAETTPETIGDKTLVCMNETEYAAYESMGMPVMAFSAQAKGFFAKYAAGKVLSEKAQSRFYSEKNVARAKRVIEVAKETGLSPAAVALCYLSCNSLPISAVFSCRTEEQMADSLTAINKKLDEKTIAYLKG